MNHSRSNIQLIYILLLHLVTLLITDVLGQLNETRQFVALKNLPELFSDEKLLFKNKDAVTCFKLIGCIQKLPSNVDPVNPLKMKTVFKVARKGKITYIPFEHTINCLQDSEECNTYPYNLELLLKSSLDTRLRTVISIGGYMSNEYEQSQEDIMNLWSEFEDINTIYVSWIGGNRGLYQYPVANTKVVSRQITVFLYYIGQIQGYDLNDEKFLSRFTIVGHSLGAHIAGFVGQDLGGLLGRITGLDPAGPSFKDKEAIFKLDRSDALLVDAIHTNGGDFSLAKADVFGHGEVVGHVDYYANDGSHQPGCLTELTGCSHKLSSNYYKSLLEHELYMRKHLSKLRNEVNKFHRIFAYRSDTYEDFKNGSSFVKYCPEFVKNNNDLYSEDIEGCIIPMDFVSETYKLKKELTTKYSIDFSKESRTKSKFFFYTRKSNPYLNNHHLIELIISKQNQELQKKCNIEIRFRMAGGSEAEYQVEHYQLFEENDHYKVMIPFLSLSLDGKYQLATLDSHDFFLNGTETLKQKTTLIFPASVRIDGFEIGSKTSSKSGGLFGMVKDFFGLARNRYDNDNRNNECNLKVEAVTIQPLKRLHRLFRAVYSLKAQNKPKPDLVVLMNDNSSLPKIQVSPSNQIESELVAPDNLEVFLDTIIVGPYNKALDEFQETIEEIDLTYEEERKQKRTNQGKIDQRIGKEDRTAETSSVKSSVWIILTAGTILSAALLLTMLMKKVSSNKQVNQDRCRLISTIR